MGEGADDVLNHVGEVGRDGTVAVFGECGGCAELAAHGVDLENDGDAAQSVDRVGE